MAGTFGVVLGCCAPFVLGIDVGALGDEVPDQLGMVVGCGEVEGGALVVVGGAEADARVAIHLEGGLVVVGCGVAHGNARVDVRRDDGVVGFEQFHHVHVP